jgi:hypothetical protein
LINENAFRGVERYADVALLSYSIVLTGNLTNAYAMIDYVNSSYRASASDIYGNILPVIREGDLIGVSPNDRFFTIRLSNGIDNNYSSSLAGGVESSGYTISSNTFEEVLSEKRIEELRETYETDYARARSMIGVPQNRDFSFYLNLDNNNRISAGTNKTKGSEVFSIEKNVKVLEKDGSISFGVLGVSIW